ncbi:MAG: hypothetical protein HQM13_18035 [SAR324 cluster bacterium]|nr:hypothetical protein [SAR324 cluster bacterium]
MLEKKDDSKKIAREEIQKAMIEFLNHGGQIQVLPSPEVTYPNYVGSEKYQIFESAKNLF